MLNHDAKQAQDIGFHPLPQPEYDLPISAAALQKIFSDCADLQARHIAVGGGQTLLWVCWLDGLVDGAEVAEQLLRPLTDALRFPTGEEALEQAARGLVYAGSMVRRSDMDELVADLLGGYCALLGEGRALCFQLKSQNRRSVAAPQTEKTIKGGKDAFVEALRVNTALVRNRLRTPKLKLRQTVVGRKSRTAVAILWLDGVAQDGNVEAIAARLDGIDAEALIEADRLTEALSEAPASPFPQVMHTERSDAFCMGLLRGQVGLLAEGLPLGFLAPGTLPAMLCTAEDAAQHFLPASALRLLRWAALLLTLFLPAFYVATAMYHPDMIPLKLLLSVIDSKQNVPFPTAAEILGMLVAFELLQEAGLRLPDSIGQTVSIVGALLFGQSAVEARVISPIAVIVVAVAGIAGYTIPNQDLSAALRLGRFVMVLAAIAAGMFGLLVAATALLWHLCSLECLGTAYMSPLSSGKPGTGVRVLARAPDRLDTIRPRDIAGADKRRCAP